jgi:ATP-dependent DNA ligase
VPVARPVLVAEFEFLEWTPDAHLRHALREDKDAKEVVRES